jgi:hypothetical protein
MVLFPSSGEQENLLLGAYAEQLLNHGPALPRGPEDKNRTNFLNVAQGIPAINILFVIHIETIRNLI